MDFLLRDARGTAVAEAAVCGLRLSMSKSIRSLICKLLVVD